MKSKILTGTAAFTLATAVGLITTAPASAQSSQEADLAAGVVDNAFATATLPFWATGYYGHYDGYYYAYAPSYTYAPDYAYTRGYNNAPLYGYYGAYDWGPWSYRGGPHPR
jgi:hypothetical protein